MADQNKNEEKETRFYKRALSSITSFLNETLPEIEESTESENEYMKVRIKKNKEVTKRKGGVYKSAKTSKMIKKGMKADLRKASSNNLKPVPVPLKKHKKNVETEIVASNRKTKRKNN